MSENTRIRFGLQDWDRVDGVTVCDHIKLPNAYENNDHSEYASGIDIYCSECDETYSYTELIN